MDTERLPSPRWPHRLAARLGRARLDDALACGADPSRSPALAARAAALTAPRARLELAERLEALASGACQRPRRLRVIPPRGSLVANAPALSELVALLRGPAPLYARGLAMLTGLLTDGAGPLYRRGHAEALAIALSDARFGLAGHAPAAPPGRLVIRGRRCPGSRAARRPDPRRRERSAR